MSIHQPPPRQPDLPPWLVMAKKFYGMFTIIEMALRSERRQRQRDFEALRSEIAALREKQQK